MSTLPAPVVHVHGVYINCASGQTAGEAIAEAADILREDDLITGLAGEVFTEQKAATYFRAELRQALGLSADDAATDTDLMVTTGTSIVAARLYLAALDRVRMVCDQAHRYTSPGELALAVQSAAHPLSDDGAQATASMPAVTPSNGIPTPPAGSALAQLDSTGDAS